MKSLLLLDWYTLWKQLKLFLFFIAFYAVMALMSQSYAFLGFSVLFLCMMPYYLLQLNDNTHVDALLLLMPVGRTTVVAERYVTALLSAACALPIFLAAGLIMGGDAVTLLVLQLAAGLLVLALLLPLAYKFGATKSRMLMLVMLALFFSTSGIISGLLTEDNGLPEIAIDHWVGILARFALPAALVLLGVSYLVSLRIYQKREF
ncbi:MAG: ABC-2 transporter permease [Candidatus Onthomonas sp.]